MRYIFLILLLVSCDKEKLSKCEIEQTFTLKFYNCSGTVKSLSAGGDTYNVSKIDHLDVTVYTFEASFVSVTYTNNNKRDTTVFMSGRPNPCAIYYFCY